MPSYINIGPLQNTSAWGQPNPMLDIFQQQGQQIANQGNNPYMEVDPNQNTRQPITSNTVPSNIIQPNIKTRTVREPFNQKYMMGSNAFFTGLGMLGSRNKNSYSNAVNNFNRNQSEYENNNSDLYSTNQDYYGKYQQGGNIKTLYETMSQDPTYYADELQVLQGDYDKLIKQQDIEQYKTIDEYIDAKINGIQPQRQEEDMTYQPYQSPQRRSFTEEYQPTYAPQMNIGFNPKSTNMYQISKQLEGMRYQMGAKGSNNKIDCSGAVCKIVGAPTMTSEDVTTHGKNFRRFQGIQDLTEGTVLGFDFGPKKHDKGRKIGIDHTGVIVKNPSTNQLEYKESVSGTGFRTLSIPQFLQKYPKRAKQIFVSDYGKN